MPDRKRRLVPGLPDEVFARGDVPLTKREIRCLTLSALEIREGDRILDVGAGSGGLSIECALLLEAGGGFVWAVEKEAPAADLLAENIARQGLTNVTLVRGTAPAALGGLGPFDGIIIGGSGGRLQAIVEEAGRILQPGGTLVLNCILLDTLHEGLAFLQEGPFEEVRIMQAAICRGTNLGRGYALKPLNPVFIISARREGAP